MRTSRRLLLAVLCLTLLAAAFAVAAETAKPVTLTGKIACEHCVLHAKTATHCANVFIATEQGKEVQYRLAENDVTKALGYSACGGAIAAKVTGTIAEVKGEKTITATKIDKG